MMNQYDPVKSLRQLKSKPDVVPFASVLIIVLVVFSMTFPGFCCTKGRACLPEAIYDDVLFYQGPVVLVHFNGSIFVNGQCMECEAENIHLAIEERLRECHDLKKPIALKAGRNESFGHVQLALQALKKLGYKKVTLITEEYVNVLSELAAVQERENHKRTTLTHTFK